jgi:hypothetical protein
LDCTGFADLCGPGEVCRWAGYGWSFCVPVDDAGLDQRCDHDQFVCDEDHACYANEHLASPARCVQICSFAPADCPDGTDCVMTAGGYGLCLSAVDQWEPGGSPL